MRSFSTSRGRAISRQAGAIALLLLCAAPLAVLLFKGTSRGFADLLVHLSLTVLPMQLGYSLAASAGAVFFGALLALGGVLCGFFDFPGRRLLERALLTPLLIPAWFLAVLFEHETGFSGPLPLAIVLGMGSAPLFQLLVTASLRSIPRQYHETLRQLGRGSPWQLLRNLFPLAGPSLAASSVLVFLLTWADAGSARIMAVPTLAVGLYDQWFGRMEDSAGALIVLPLLAGSLLPALAAWAWFSRRGWQSSGRLVPRRADRVRLRGAAALLPWLLGAPLLVAGVIFPYLRIALWTVNRVQAVDLTMIGQDMLRSLLLAAGGTLIAAGLAIWSHQHQVAAHARRLTAATGGIMIAVFSVPPVALGLAFLWMLPESADRAWAAWLNATPLPLAAALGVRFCGVFWIAGQAALLRTARVHSDVLRTYGRADLVSFLRLFRPYLSPPLVMAAGFVFLESLKDLPLSLILQPFGFTTLTTRLFQYAQTQRIPESAVLVLCLVLVGIYPLAMLARLAEPGQAGDRD
jgi:iron(III) transport system permease protein